MKLSHITKDYNKTRVLDDFSLEIVEGEILAVLGESGVGKTTILNILSGLIPFEGEAIDIPKKKAYIFQEPRLIPNLTVKENLLFSGASIKKAEDILLKTEMLDKSNKRPNHLSGGEKQRVSIARAFATDFDLLLMDEPFSALDTALKIRLIEVFSKLWENAKELNKLVSAVFITHDLEEALMIADRIVVMKKGEIVADERIQRDLFPMPYGLANPMREKLLNILLYK